MIVHIDDILNLAKKNISDLKLIPISDIYHIYSREKIWDKGKKIPGEVIAELKANGVGRIDLLFSNFLYKALVDNCSENYRYPSEIKSFFEIDKIMNTYEKLNRISKRQRTISFMHEIYDTHGKSLNPIFRFQEEVNFTKWNSNKGAIRTDTKLPILYNEHGIIIFVDLSKKSDDYLLRFRKNTDLCSLLTQRRGDYADFNFSPDFNSMTDIWTVNDPNKLLQTYIEKNARLIIMGEKINDSYKNSLIKLKKYDKFARLMVATDINLADCKSILMRIKKAYNSNNFTIE